MGLTGQQLRCITWLRLGYEDKDTAAKVGIHPNTISKWRCEDADFKAALDATEKAAVERAISMASKHLEAAAASLVDALDATNDKGRPDWRNRIDAAKALLQTHGMLKERVESSEEKTLRIIIEDDREALVPAVDGQVRVLELPTGDDSVS